MSDWKTMKDGREKYGRYLASREWGVLKEAVHKRAGGKCERCRINGIDAVHHLTYIRKYQESLDDLQAICKPCHEFTHGKSDHDPARRPAFQPTTPLDYITMQPPTVVERQLLHVLATHPKAHQRISAVVNPAMFIEPEHWWIFEAIMANAKQDRKTAREELMLTGPESEAHNRCVADIYSTFYEGTLEDLLTDFQFQSKRYNWSMRLAVALHMAHTDKEPTQLHVNKLISSLLSDPGWGPSIFANFAESVSSLASKAMHLLAETLLK